MPEDTAESIEASCRFIDEADVDDIALSIATPYPGTKLYEQCLKDGLLNHDMSTDELYITDWYSHANINKFCIRPYRIDENTLIRYRDRILAMRSSKITAYRQRMRSKFGIP
jgi:hypothetical protein